MVGLLYFQAAAWAAVESVDSPRPKSMLGETPRAAGLLTLTTANLAVESVDSLPTQVGAGRDSTLRGLSPLTTAWILRAPYANWGLHALIKIGKPDGPQTTVG